MGAARPPCSCKALSMPSSGNKRDDGRMGSEVIFPKVLYVTDSEGLFDLMVIILGVGINSKLLA